MCGWWQTAVVAVFWCIMSKLKVHGAVLPLLSATMNRGDDPEVLLRSIRFLSRVDVGYHYDFGRRPSLSLHLMHPW